MLESTKNKDLKAIHITLKNSLSNDLLISNLNFVLDINESFGFYFKENKSKEAFISLFQEKNKKFSGMFFWNNNIYSKSFFDITEKTSIYTNSSFDTSSKEQRAIEIIERKIYESLKNDILNVIKNNNKNEKHIKILKILKYKNIEIDYIKRINDKVENSIYQINKLLSKLNQAIKNRNKQYVINIYNELIKCHSIYLKNRIELLIKKNISIIDLYLLNYNNENFYFSKKNIYKSKILLELLNKINNPDEDLQNFKQKFQLLLKNETKNKNYNINKYQNEKNNKKIIKKIFLDLNYKFNIYKSKIKEFRNDNKEYSIYNERIKNNITFKKIFYKKRKEIKKIINLNESFIYKKSFDLYKNVLMNLEEYLNDKSEKNKIKKIVIDEINLFINNLHEQEIKTNQKNENHFIDEKFDNKKTEDIFINIEDLKSKSQDLIDEIDWEKKKIFINTNEKLKDISAIENTKNEKYLTNKNIYNNLVNTFLEIKNKFLENENDENIKKSLESSIFINESLKLEIIYKFISQDSKTIENLFLKNININILKNKDTYETFIISRYITLKTCLKFEISIFDLLTRNKKIDALLKNTIILILAHLDKKEIIIFDNFFSDINKNIINKISLIYNKITKNSNKVWILLENRLDKIYKFTKKSFIIDKSRQIEFGLTTSLIENPIYSATIESVGYDVSNFKERSTPQIFNKIIDYNKNYDYYEYENSHYIYGNLDMLYNWTNIVPEQSKYTLNLDNLKRFKNKVQFDNSQKKVKKTYFKNVDLLESKEFLIIDVKK